MSAIWVRPGCKAFQKPARCQNWARRLPLAPLSLICLPLHHPGHRVKTLNEVKQNSRSCLLWKNLAHETTGCLRVYMSYWLQNVQYQESDQNKINKLPTWGILFNKTLTKKDEINKIINDIFISTKWERDAFYPQKNLIVPANKDKKKTTGKSLCVQYIKDSG